MKSDREIARILAAYDATESIGRAAIIAGCDPKTVRRYVEARAAGQLTAGPSPRSRLAGPYLDRIEEWVERSEGCIGADRVHQRLMRLGFTGSERTTRRAVAEVKARWTSGDRRGRQPWSPEPGLWLQFGWTQGPLVHGPFGRPTSTVLFSAWLAWSRFRVVIPCRDNKLATLAACVDTALRTLGGAPTYLLTRLRTADTHDGHGLDAIAWHYGAEARTCVPYDARSRDSVGSGIPVAAHHWMPTTADLSAHYPSFGVLRAACERFTRHVNGSGRREAGPQETPLERLGIERTQLHPVPALPYRVPGAPYPLG